MIFVVVLVLSIIFGFLAWLADEKMCNFGVHISALLLSLILAVIGIVQGCIFFSGILTYEADCIKYATTREIYVDELRHYDEMRDTDVTASSTYLELREKIINFNHNVDFAKQHDNIWFRHAVTDPAYTTVDTIDLGVG